MRLTQYSVAPTAIAINAIAPRAAPTPIPAFAPGLRFEEEDAVDGGADVVEFGTAVDVLELDVEVVDDQEGGVEDEITIGLSLKALLCNWLFTQPFPVPVSPLGSFKTRT